jgi:hypothetical protein
MADPFIFSEQLPTSRTSLSMLNTRRQSRTQPLGQDSLACDGLI